LNFVPTSLLRARGNITSWAAELAPPTISSFGEHVVDRLDRRRVPGDADTVLDVGVADPVELQRVEPSVLVSQQGLQRRGAGCDGEFRSIARGVVVDIVGGDQAARSRHVLDHEGRIARKILAHVPGERLGIEARAAAGAEADRNLDLPALVEVGDRVLRAAVERETQQRERSERHETAINPHAIPPR
jgi:hypothetical protein